MRGFAITPILFAGLLLVVGLMAINFIDIDKKVAEGITKEGRAKKVLIDYEEEKLVTENLVVFYSLQAVNGTGSGDNLNTSVENYLETNLGGIANVIYCENKQFDVEYRKDYSDQLIDAVVNKEIAFSKTITCDMAKEIGVEGDANCGNVFFDCP